MEYTNPAKEIYSPLSGILICQNTKETLYIKSKKILNSDEYVDDGIILLISSIRNRLRHLHMTISHYDDWGDTKTEILSSIDFIRSFFNITTLHSENFLYPQQEKILLSLKDIRTAGLLLGHTIKIPVMSADERNNAIKALVDFSEKFEINNFIDQMIFDAVRQAIQYLKNFTLIGQSFIIEKLYNIYRISKDYSEKSNETKKNNLTILAVAIISSVSFISDIKGSYDSIHWIYSEFSESIRSITVEPQKLLPKPTDRE